MIEADIKFALVALSAVFFVIDPFANVPIFLTITASASPAQRRRIAWRAALATWITLSIFALGGGVIFRAFGISLGAFKIAGGLMLLLMAIDMMRAQPSPTRTTAEEQGEACLRDADPTPMLRRELSDQLDDLARALRVRTAATAKVAG